MLEIKDLTLHYGAAQALKGVSLVAEEGKITTVLGRNGVGKTSLLRAIAGRHPHSGGTITLDGVPLPRGGAAQVARAGIAYVPQGREIFPLLTVTENLTTEVGQKEDRKVGASRKTAIAANDTLHVGDTLEIKAGTKIKLSVGGSSIEMTSTGVTIKALAITIEASGQLAMGGTLTKLDGSASVTIQGGMVMIN